MNKDAYVYILSNKNHSVIYGEASGLGKKIIQQQTGFLKMYLLADII